MRVLPHLFTAVVSIAIAYALFVWTYGGSSNTKDSVSSAPSMVEPASRALQSVVSINTRKLPGGSDSLQQDDKSGSGTIISADGHIVTNFHVVSQTASIHVTLFDGHEYHATVVGKDSLHDIALIKIQGRQFPYLEFGNSDSVQVGESVIAAGNPYKLGFTITGGIISAVNRDLRVDGNDVRAYIQTDVPINTGNSGGPLLNAQGHVVGIMAILITVRGGYEGYSFAIPSNIVRKIADDLRQYGKLNKGSLGIMIRNVTHEIAQESGMHEITGVVVDALTDGGAADRDGVKSLDIILSANGKKAESTAVFVDLLLLYSPGDTLHLLVNREGKELPIDVVLNEPSQ